jgi:hypothetical protein
MSLACVRFLSLIHDQPLFVVSIKLLEVC